ncbi:MAG: class I SAM-dependent methyltransferase [Alphaproteobacteria bacterium]|nr:class I SAM-dependent methyltransferase [Alphaproteobacteria bacterium]
MSDFYASYGRFKQYATPSLSAKIMRRMDLEIWEPAGCEAGQRFLELGCGTGQVMAYLVAKGVKGLVGADHDHELAKVIPEAARPYFHQGDIRDILADEQLGLFDRVLLLDVLEHFTAHDGRELLEAIRRHMAPGAKLLLKVPNAASPWGIQYQHGDLTHLTAYTPLSLRQMAEASGFELERFYAPLGGSPRRRITEALLNRFLAWALTSPPDLFSANMYGILKAR